MEQEMDGVQLDHLTPGRVCDVSPSLGSWLIAQGYAELEMRSSAMTDDTDFAAPVRGAWHVNQRRPARQIAADRRKRPR